MTLESAHVEIMLTLTEERLSCIEQTDKRSLPKIVIDALHHELLNIIELRELLANHAKD